MKNKKNNEKTKKNDFIVRGQFITKSLHLHELVWEYINEQCKKCGVTQSKYTRDSIDSALKPQICDELIELYEANPRVDETSGEVLREILMGMTAAQLLERRKILKEMGFKGKN